MRRSGRTRAAKQNLVGVDAPDARDDSLVREGSLEGDPVAGESLSEHVHRQAVDEWIGPEAGEVGGQPVRSDVVRDVPLSEGPRVDEAQLTAVAEPRRDVGVGGRLRERYVVWVCQPEQLAAHAEVDHQHLVVVEDEGEELSLPPGGDDGSAT